MDFPTFKNVYNKTGMELLPHRPPFLFVDMLFSADETGAIGEYTYTLEKNDFFKGHFPGYPVVPGVVLVETMAQVAGAAIVAQGIVGSEEGKTAAFLLASVDEARFRHPVRPGDKMTVVVQNVKVRKPLGIFKMKGYVNGEVAAECAVKCMIGDR